MGRLVVFSTIASLTTVVVAAVGHAHFDADTAPQTGCGQYEHWHASLQLASPRGRGASPREAVRSLADDQVSVRGVVDQEAGHVQVRVVRKGVTGVYGVKRDGPGWVVTRGDGCGASGGAPMPPEDVECQEGQPAPDQTEWLSYCFIEGAYPSADDYFYPED